MKSDCRLPRNCVAVMALAGLAVFFASCDNKSWPEYTVNFNLNGGTGSVPSSRSVDVRRTDSITLPTSDWFSRSGFLFSGWNTRADGTGTNFSAGYRLFTPGAHARNGTVTLYARWEGWGAIPDLAGQLTWLRRYAQSGGSYTIELGSDEFISPADAALPTGRTDLTIIIRGIGARRTVSLAASGNLLTVGYGVTLVLDNNITLMGRGPNAVPVTASNNNHLIRVNDGGTLVMNAGARVTGNTNTSTTWGNTGGGVRVNSGGTFNMRGGEIAGNTAGGNATGGGVHVESGGTFRISDGVIYGNDAAEGLRNTAVGGAALFVASNGTAQRGTFANGTFSSLSNLTTANSTIHVGNGVFQLALAEGTLAGRLAWLRDFAQSGGSYVIELSGDETIAPCPGSGTLTLPTGRTNLTITLRGSDAVRTVSLSESGVLFTVGSGVMLVLDNNITLMGRGPNAVPATESNDNHLIRVNDGGTLVMNAGARVTGNTNTSWASNIGGGVLVGGTFNMRGGEIAGNSVFATVGPTGFPTGFPTGGGVHVVSGGIFRISDGVIYGSDAAAGLRNTGVGGAASLFLASGGTAQRGIFGNDTFTSLGNLSSTSATIDVEDGVLRFSLTEGTLAERLARLGGFAQSGGSYVIELSGNETLAPWHLPTGRTNLTITLRGTGAARTVNLSASGVLFTVGDGVTLVLDNNITLMGRGPNAVPATEGNWTHLIRVNGGGTLVMNAGSRVTGNANNSSGDNAGGGVRVNSGGTFVMRGGEIAGNSGGGSSTGGGVHVASGGTFRISDGVIHGSDAVELLRNVATGSGSGASLFVADNGMAQSGTFGNGTFTSLGNLSTTNATIDVEDGVLRLSLTEGTLAERFTRLRNFAQSGGSYVIELSENETLGPEQTGGGTVPTLPTGRTNLTITLRGIGAVRTVNLSDNGVLFTIGSGVTLVLDNNITLMGRGPNAVPATGSNWTHLIRVNDGGTLVMNAGSRVTGNTNTSSWGNTGGGVRVNSGGTFDMRGGEIAGNSAVAYADGGSTTDGGVHVASGGTFRISDGVIRGNYAAEGFRNTVIGRGSGASLFNSGMAQRGTFNAAGAFTSLGTLSTVNATISVANGVFQMVGTLAEQLAQLRAFAQSNGSYVIELSGDETIAPCPGWGTLTFPTGRTNLTITLRGSDAVRTVSLSESGVLFTVGSGVTLVLDNNITLMGRGPNAVPATESNNNHLIRVNDSGTLVMNAGARVTGNTNSASSSGGGVHVASGGMLNMHGGEIAGNSAGSSSGGGVHVANGGTFRISDGVIHGSDAAEGLRNVATGWNSGASLFNSGTAERGTFNVAGTFSRLDTLSTTNDTIHMVNGALAP